MAENVDRQTFHLREVGDSPTGLIRRAFCRLLGATAVALGFGLKQSLAGVARVNALVAEPIVVNCPEQHCVIEVDSNGIEQSRYYQIGRHRATYVRTERTPRYLG